MSTPLRSAAHGKASTLTSAGALPKRGRPPRLSRDAILDGGFAVLRRAPREALTVARIAAQVDAVPGALYRHFSSLDDLLDGILARVLAALQIDVRRRAAWPAQIRGWMTAMRAQLLRYPAVLPLIGRRGRTSPAWLDAVAAPIAILERAGLCGAELARTHLWLTETTVALITQEASLAVPEQIRGARASVKEMSPERRAALLPLLTHLAATDGDEMFAFAVDRTIAALSVLVDDR